MSNAGVSNNFTIDDIHKIRYANYEHIKNMTHQEIIEHTRKEAQYGLDFLKALKKSKMPFLIEEYTCSNQQIEE